MNASSEVRSAPLILRFVSRTVPALAGQASVLIAVWAASLVAVANPVDDAGLERPSRCDEPSAPGDLFPFTICGDQFYRDGSPVFLHILCYQPLEPCQEITDPILDTRICDDLHRLRAYQGGSDPVILRVYPQPTGDFPNRMPQSFYDGVRELGFWIIRDIYFPAEDCDDADGHAAIDAVIAEVDAANAMDLIFAWGFGNEYACGACDDLPGFLDDMCTYLKTRMAEPGHQGYSDWVTWAAWPPVDPLYTDPWGCPVFVPNLDYYSHNAYPYWPERIRDHQGGQGTGTPHAGYLAALKEYLPDKPLVISETGLSDSPSVGNGEQPSLKPWSPIYRYGGLSGDQVAEGLVDRYWDARLVGAAGIAFFEWNDEWHKVGQPCVHDDHPEEYFGLVSFDKHQPGVPEVARYKLQQEVVRDLFAMQFPSDPPSITLTPDDTSIPCNGSTTIHAEVSGGTLPVRFRWETTRGRIVGDSESVELYAASRALGPAEVTAAVIDAEGRANTASCTVQIDPPNGPELELLTLGPGSPTEARASGLVQNVDLTQYKVILYIETNRLYVQPYKDAMESIWVRPDGYWWSQVTNNHDGDLVAWVVPASFDPNDEDPGWEPPEYVAADRLEEANDSDNDLLPDWWELLYFGTLDYGRHDDPDDDMADNLEEFLAGTDPAVPDNDSDGDDLADTWEWRLLGTLAYSANDDPDGDGLANQDELALGIHPGRTAVDRDRDELPDTWEMRWFGNLDQGPDDDPNEDGLTNLEAYELGISPLLCPGDLNGDNLVDQQDLGILLADWGCIDSICPGDLDRDCDTDQSDLGILLTNWGRTCP